MSISVCCSYSTYECLGLCFWWHQLWSIWFCIFSLFHGKYISPFPILWRHYMIVMNMNKYGEVVILMLFTTAEMITYSAHSNRRGKKGRKKISTVWHSFFSRLWWLLSAFYVYFFSPLVMGSLESGLPWPSTWVFVHLLVFGGNFLIRLPLNK